MPKLSSMIVARPCSDKPGRVLLETPYSQELIDKLKHYPGAEWNREAGGWYFPIECLGLLNETIRQLEKTPVPFEPAVNDKLLSFQKSAVHKILNDEGHLVSFEQGLGKTATTIEALRLLWSAE